jgi:hypothetical protein
MPPGDRIKTLVRSANGSSQPWFCLLDDDSSWLVKFAGAGPGPDALLAEFVAGGLGRLWGLPIPECKAVLLDSSVPRAGTDEFWDVLAASQGWNLGIRTIPNATHWSHEGSPLDPTLEAMLAFDALTVNWDRTMMSRNLMEDQSGQIWWIDHGSCRFLHGLAKRDRPALPSTHFQYANQHRIDWASLPLPEKKQVEDLVAAIPEAWLTGTGQRQRVATELYDYLSCLLAV